ncbi:MAG: nicotinamide-nucleotide amidohydrolase family protein [Pseudomonadota bacterium]
MTAAIDDTAPRPGAADDEEAARAGVAVAAQALMSACLAADVMLCTAESCTGGMISAALIDIAGSSAVIDRGFVTYSNFAKAAHLGVPKRMLVTEGAVSEAVARAMAEGALNATAETNPKVRLALAVTGIAGPGGGTADKPEGRVHFAAAHRSEEGSVQTAHVMRDYGPLGRMAVRQASAAQALSLAQHLLENASA